MKFFKAILKSLVVIGIYSVGVFPINAALYTPGQVLAVASVSTIVGTGSQNINSITFQIGYPESIYSQTLEYALFDQYNFTSADVGKTFALTSQNDPDFSGFVQKLTNGQSELLFKKDGFGTIGGSAEANFFQSLPPGNNGIDLQGFPIGSIALHVDSLTLNSPGSDPNGNGIWTDVFFQGTITVYAVPEPASITWVGMAGILLWRQFTLRAGRGKK